MITVFSKLSTIILQMMTTQIRLYWNGKWDKQTPNYNRGIVEEDAAYVKLRATREKFTTACSLKWFSCSEKGRSFKV